MNIPQYKLKEWRELRSKGDTTPILELAEMPYDRKKPSMNVFISMVSRAFKDEKCPDWLFKALNKFYTQKKVELLGS